MTEPPRIRSTSPSPLRGAGSIKEHNNSFNAPNPQILPPT